LIESPNSPSNLFKISYAYLLKITEVEEREILKICLEFWWKLVPDLYEDHRKFPPQVWSMIKTGVLDNENLKFANESVDVSSIVEFQGPAARRMNLYAPIMSRLRSVMIKVMSLIFTLT
jgi:exportin-1